MDKWNHGPLILRRRAALTLFLGIASISITIVVFSLSEDSILLTLGSILFLCCLFRSLMLLRIITRKEYDTITGTCTCIHAESFPKYRKIYLLDDTGNETALWLEIRQKIKPGSIYRFYFQRNGPVFPGNNYPDAMLSTNQFLGYEEMYPELLE